ncbi:hypothetical protein NSE_0365 [Neorickettsia sennetsu str. Miyayama]|uniref:Uncharacterized protein n=1 Tax=Ehrlichia sennetsu (strain ATCC VR-367 / Miyayama) TaxID=222891 RepID=Q2GE42_EHRS3|nr:hypothetical protein NSE_0365 [Neorickettsia sennetsu str. Miyayama]
MQIPSFSLYSGLYLILSIVFCVVIFSLSREAIEASRVQVVMDGYAAKMEALVDQSTEWAYQKITDLCNRIINSELVEREIADFNRRNEKVYAYWFKDDEAEKVSDQVGSNLFPAVSIGKSLLQRDFGSSRGEPVLPITVVVKSPKNTGRLLFYLSLNDLFAAMEDLVRGDPYMQIAILKENNEVLLSVNLDRKVEFYDLRNKRFASFLNLIKGKYSYGFMRANEAAPIKICYFYRGDINMFSVINFIDFALLFFAWLCLSFCCCIFIWKEISKLLDSVAGKGAEYHFHIREFREVYAGINFLSGEVEKNKSKVVHFTNENNRLKELNNIYAFERANMNATIDELAAEKEILLIDKMVSEEKIDYLKRKVKENEK